MITVSELKNKKLWKLDHKNAREWHCNICGGWGYKVRAFPLDGTEREPIFLLQQCGCYDNSEDVLINPNSHIRTGYDYETGIITKEKKNED